MIKVKITVSDDYKNLFEDYSLKTNKSYYEYMKDLINLGYRLNFRTNSPKLLRDALLLTENKVIEANELEIKYELVDDLVDC